MVARDADIELETAGSKRAARSAIVLPNVAHRMTTDARDFSLMLIDPRGPRGRALVEASLRLGESREPRRLIELLSLMRAASPASFLEAALGTLGIEAGGAGVRDDPAIESAVRLIEDRHGIDVTLVEAARLAHVSPSHLSRAFAARVGVPFGRYRLWVRMRAAAHLLAEGANATEAATGAGFSDAAHLSRTFRSLLGLPPSVVGSMRWERPT